MVLATPELVEAEAVEVFGELEVPVELEGGVFPDRVMGSEERSEAQPHAAKVPSRLVGPLNDTERYHLDVAGFVVRRGVLGGGELAAVHEAVDALELPEPDDTIARQRFTGHLGRAECFRTLLDHPAVLDVVTELCGPFVRLDHAYGIVMAPGTSGLGLHGGGTPFDPAQYYEVKGGSIHCGLIAVQWMLVDHPPGGGGFTCVPGSHKAAFPNTAAARSALSVEVPMSAGDVVIFTEALTHGTLPWQGPGQRRTLLYKYSPGNSSWAREPAVSPDVLGLLSDRQRRLCQPPSVAYHQRVEPAT